MDKREIRDILREYGICAFSEWSGIDSTNGGDYRLNIVVDKKYVLRINSMVMTEERLASIDRLSERYRSIGVLAPHLFKNRAGKYLTAYGGRVCYVSEYLDCPLWAEVGEETDPESIRKEVLQMVGRFSRKFSDTDLSDVMSMWSVIDLAPLDTAVDEKQENLDLLTEKLTELGEAELAHEIRAFNDRVRERIKAVYKSLPRCVIQGDLNPSNILVKNGRFIGLIDFNMAGTEVNVNHFCCETNGEIPEDAFSTKHADEIYENWVREQREMLDVILSEYQLNDLEKQAIGDYRRICRISMYPNVMSFIEYLKRDKEKMMKILKKILTDPMEWNCKR